ncbi:hypothetical protein CBS63078_7909 [Aspergillus niger]|uniref:Contig An12c0220, genomic contig n=4 Tax=Aspergillus niger TaxID=5061 RepID=A2R034_ASPNC|nr:uncharacterized protein BO96DRAFT_351156 [Aspergillus niger CBS 101883]XP_059604530.1 uncharacterized protein An12g07200 [Aspergillus niger]EHA25434.1 hypothetical protein ASPNIDRAFT_42209 [Aspergillus niger ATCC 1015]RDH21754.1 hypothetical protein M747DRAFT_294518 [Aspergillus niger ATCC 13496]KAI2812661.1 hypothetical protein CBS115989_10221 [Aspergillus niger]KAI2824194.1 hypothetical protein CBS133816_8931 [Aspergillus niger]KAI2834360.1 hypothetical protein CBS11350_10775 [Aspergillu
MSEVFGPYLPDCDVVRWAERLKQVLTEKHNPITRSKTQSGFHLLDYTIVYKRRFFEGKSAYETCKFVHKDYNDIIILVGCDAEPSTGLPTAVFLDARAHELCAETASRLPLDKGLYVAKVWQGHVHFFRAVRSFGGSFAMHPIVRGDRWLLDGDADLVYDILNEIRAQFGFHSLHEPLVRLSSLENYKVLEETSRIMPEIGLKVDYGA